MESGELEGTSRLEASLCAAAAGAPAPALVFVSDYQLVRMMCCCIAAL